MTQDKLVSHSAAQVPFDHHLIEYTKAVSCGHIPIIPLEEKIHEILVDESIDHVKYFALALVDTTVLKERRI